MTIFHFQLPLLAILAGFSCLAQPTLAENRPLGISAIRHGVADAEHPRLETVGELNPSTALLVAGYDPETINLSAQQSPPNEVTDEILMADGDVIRGKITSENEHEVVIQHPVFEELRIPRSRIVAIKKSAPPRKRPGFGEVITGAGVRPPAAPQQTPAPTNAQEPATEQPAGQKLKEEQTADALTKPENWSFVIGTAFGYVQNVNEELNVRLSAQAEHKSEFARLRVDSAYFFNSANNIVIDNDVIVTTLQDWFFPDSRWSIFARGTYQWDDFEAWEHRVSGYLGPGYQLVNSPTLAIDLRVGAGATYEYGIPQTLPEALVSFEWAWKIDDRQKFNGIFSYAPDITQLEQYRLSLNAEWNFRLQKEEGLSFYVGVRDEFQSIVPTGSTNNDLRVFGGIKYEF